MHFPRKKARVHRQSRPHTWNDPEAQRWNRRRHSGRQSQCRWTRFDLENTIMTHKQYNNLCLVLSMVWRREKPKHDWIFTLRHTLSGCPPKWLFTSTKYLLTTVVLNPEHKVATWVTDCFHGDAREFGHWGLGKQLPCYLEQHKHGYLSQKVERWPRLRRKLPTKVTPHCFFFSRWQK